MKLTTYKNLGFSIVKLMVTVAISGILALTINSVYSNYIQQKYAIESKAAALADIDTASKFLRVNLPYVIYNTIGLDGTTDFPPNWWTCDQYPGMCVLSAYLTADHSIGAVGHAWTKIISAQCQSITDTALKTSSINTFAVDQTNEGDCTKCPIGMMPVVYITSFSKASKKFTNNFQYLVLPSVVNKIQAGTIATGLYFNHAGYQYNNGTAAAPINITRYDRWTITLIAVYLKAPIPPNATAPKSTIYWQKSLNALWSRHRVNLAQISTTSPTAEA